MNNRKRYKLYRLLVENFGPYKIWKLLSSPSEESKVDYNTFYKNITETFEIFMKELKTEIG